jgi:hypothetical protein
MKALEAQGLKLLPKPKHLKATLTESLTLLLFQGQDLAKPCERVSWGYLAPKTALNAHFPYPTARCSPRRKQRPLERT